MSEKKEYIERKAAIKAAQEGADVWDGGPSYSRDAEIQDCINKVPPADVVARDCYDRILTENDIMREQLAAIGKRPGDSMDDAKSFVRGEWVKKKHMMYCSECCAGFDPINYNDFLFCPNCGADMRGAKNDSETCKAT